jgi:hypothetical protein
VAHGIGPEFKSSATHKKKSILNIKDRYDKLCQKQQPEEKVLVYRKIPEHFQIEPSKRICVTELLALLLQLTH